MAQSAWVLGKPFLGFVDQVMPQEGLPQRWARSDSIALDLKNWFSNLSAILHAAIFPRDLTFSAKPLFGFVDRVYTQVGLLQRWAETDSIALDLKGTNLQTLALPRLLPLSLVFWPFSGGSGALRLSYLPMSLSIGSW